MVRYSDGTLHYTINGEDQGVACHNIPAGVFAVIDLYGQVSAALFWGPDSIKNHTRYW
jgi:neuralized-like protein 4